MLADCRYYGPLYSDKNPFFFFLKKEVKMYYTIHKKM